eukprot:458853_1
MSAMLTTVKMFVFITHIIYTHGERTRFCDAGTDELFYDNANNFIGTNWTWDNDGEPKNWYYEYSLPSHAADDHCYTESCYAFYAVDFVIDALITNPSFTSVPISTIDHWNIYIIFSVATYQIGSTTGSCVTSYTVNNGDDFDEIHSQPTLIAQTPLFYPNITRALGTNAENINNLQIKLWIMDTETDPKVGENIQCIYDEILICGTTITPAPTSMTLSPTSNTASPTSNTALPTSNTASPTSNTALPTSNTASPTSNTALPTSNTGSPSQTPTSNTLPPSVSPTSNTASPTSNTALPTSNTAS